MMIADKEYIQGIVKQIDEAFNLGPLSNIEFEDGEFDDCLADMLANLRHWADAKQIDFYHALDRSYRYYCSEKQEAQNGSD